MTKKIGIFGGTFDVLHDGHHALLITAFREGDHIRIGVTADNIANDSRDRTVKPFSKRVANLEEACKRYENIFDATYEISKIKNPIEPALDPAIDFIVLSPESKTHERANKINEKREEQGMDRLKIIEAPMVTDHNGEKISSTKVIAEKINRHGEKS